MKVIWSEKAKLSYFRELDFILEKWNYQEVQNFIDLIDDFVFTLKSGIFEGKVSPGTNLHSFVIAKQTTLYFDVNKKRNRIELLLFWNNLQDPKQLQKELKQR